MHVKETIPCPACGESISIKANICPLCGIDLGFSEEMAFESEPEEKYVKKIVPPAAKVKQNNRPLKKQKPYNPNRDHYYDDVLPELIKENTAIAKENILKAIGIIIGIFFIIVYLIFML